MKCSRISWWRACLENCFVFVQIKTPDILHGVSKAMLSGGASVGCALIGPLVPISSKPRRHLQGRIVAPHAVPGQGSALANPGLASQSRTTSLFFARDPGQLRRPSLSLFPPPHPPPSTRAPLGVVAVLRSAFLLLRPWERNTRNTRTELFCILPCSARCPLACDALV